MPDMRRNEHLLKFLVVLDEIVELQMQHEVLRLEVVKYGPLPALVGAAHLAPISGRLPTSGPPDS